MRVSVVSEKVFLKTPDGAYWSAGAGESFWKRYLDVFDKLLVTARVHETTAPPAGGQLIADPRIQFAEVPYYRGPAHLLRQFPQVRSILKASYHATDAVLLRIPSTLANLITPVLRKANHPYAVEVVGDPHDVFAPAGISHPLRPLFRHWFSRNQISQCRNATAVAYVTQSRLQSRYQAPASAFTTHYSSLDLPDIAFADQPRQPHQFENKTLKLVTVASLSQLYKAPEILIDSFSRCLSQGLDLQLEIVGEGVYRNQLEQQVRGLQIEDRVDFQGQLPGGSTVWQRLDASDLFVLPSKTEGLPRAMIEAMARGLPCLGSTAGGFPELLSDDYLVTPGCRNSLAKKIHQVSTNPVLLGTMSRENLRRAQDYRADRLRARRIDFYRNLLQETIDWTRRVAA